MYKIYDDCVSRDVIYEIEKILLERSYRWSYLGYTVTPSSPDPQMSHVLYAFDPYTKQNDNYIKSKFSYILNYLFEEMEKNTDLNINERIMYRAKSTILFPPAKKQKQESDIHIEKIIFTCK